MRKQLWIALTMLGGLALCCPGVQADDSGEKDVALDKLPKAVTDAVMKQFPKAELVKAVEEDEDDETMFEVKIKAEGQNVEVSLDKDGKIEGYEKELAVTELPKPVADAVALANPKSTIKSVEAVYELEDGKEELEYYEVQVDNGGNVTELKVKASGKLIEDKEEKKDEKKSEGAESKEESEKEDD